MATHSTQETDKGKRDTEAEAKRYTPERKGPAFQGGLGTSRHPWTHVPDGQPLKSFVPEIPTVQRLGFPGGTSGKEPACQCRRCKRCRFNPWVWNAAPFSVCLLQSFPASGSFPMSRQQVYKPLTMMLYIFFFLMSPASVS